MNSVPNERDNGGAKVPIARRSVNAISNYQMRIARSICASRAAAFSHLPRSVRSMTRAHAVGIASRPN